MFILLIKKELPKEGKRKITELYYKFRDLMKVISLLYFVNRSISEHVVQDAFFNMRKFLLKAYI